MQNLKTVIADILNNVGSTLSACGDVNRNVMAAPAPYKNKPEYQYAWEYAVDTLRPEGRRFLVHPDVSRWRHQW